MTRWSSTSRLAPEGAPRSRSSAEDFELRAALEESSVRRAELIQKLQEARGQLDAQTDLLKTKGSQLQQSQSISNVLDMKHKVWLKKFELYRHWILEFGLVWWDSKQERDIKVCCWSSSPTAAVWSSECSWTRQGSCRAEPIWGKPPSRGITWQVSYIGVIYGIHTLCDKDINVSLNN